MFAIILCIGGGLFLVLLLKQIHVGESIVVDSMLVDTHEPDGD